MERETSQKEAYELRRRPRSEGSTKHCRCYKSDIVLSSVTNKERTTAVVAIQTPSTPLKMTTPTPTATTTATAMSMSATENVRPRMVSRSTQWEDVRRGDMNKKIKQEVHRAIQRHMQREKKFFGRSARPAPSTLPAAAHLHAPSLAVPTTPALPTSTVSLFANATTPGGYIYPATAGYLPISAPTQVAQAAQAGYAPAGYVPASSGPTGYIPAPSGPTGYVAAPSGPTGYVPASSGPAGYVPFYK